MSEKSIPLSQAPGKKKIIIGIPVSAICFLLAYIGFLPPITRMLGVFLAAYATIGIVEIILGDSLETGSKKWEKLASWQKLCISTIIIVGIFVLIILMMPLVAEYV